MKRTAYWLLTAIFLALTACFAVWEYYATTNMVSVLNGTAGVTAAPQEVFIGLFAVATGLLVISLALFLLFLVKSIRFEKHRANE